MVIKNEQIAPIIDRRRGMHLHYSSAHLISLAVGIRSNNRKGCAAILGLTGNERKAFIRKMSRKHHKIVPLTIAVDTDLRIRAMLHKIAQLHSTLTRNV